MSRSRPIDTGLLVVADSGLLVALWPDVPALIRGGAAPRTWLAAEGTDRVLVTAAGAGLWCVAAWVALGLLAAGAGRLPGTTGALALTFAHRVLPAALRRVVIGSAGLGVLLSPISPLSPVVAGAQPPDVPGGRPAVTAAPPSVPLPGPTWPGSGTDRPRPAPLPAGPSWPGSVRPDHHLPTVPKAAPSGTSTPGRAPTPSSTPTPASTPKPAPATRSTHPPSTPSVPPRTVPAPVPHRDTPAGGSRTSDHTTDHATDHATVRAGDCLWLLAAHRVGPRATDSDVARYLPELYAANRDVIGDDPGLVRPGQRLTLPVPSDQE